MEKRLLHRQLDRRTWQSIFERGKNQRPRDRYAKLIILTLFWILFTAILIMEKEKIDVFHQVTIPANESIDIMLGTNIFAGRIDVKMRGSFFPVSDYRKNVTPYENYLTTWLELENSEKNQSTQARENVSEFWILPLLPLELMAEISDEKSWHTFELSQNLMTDKNSPLILKLATNLNTTFSLSISYNLSAINLEDGATYGVIVLIGLYVVIVLEVVHRTIAAMLASTMSIAILASLGQRPSATEILTWIDMDTLLLLFSMMLLVAVFAETGAFDYLAVYAYKISKGRIWPLISTLCFFTAFVSLFLDNVTTVLLMTPVTIRLCEVLELNPVPILTAMIMFSNIGGAATPVGDPPNVIITSNKDLISAGVNFGTYVLHMSPGVLLVLGVVYGHLRFMFRNSDVLNYDEPLEIQELRHKIVIWQRAAASLSTYSADEDLVRQTLLSKVDYLRKQLRQKLIMGQMDAEHYKVTLEDLQEKYPIRDGTLLIKVGVSLAFVVVMFFLHSVPGCNLSLGWTALLGVLLLLIIADSEDFDGLMARVEWSTLVFFAALFVLMEALSKLGLIAWIGTQTENVILTVDEDSRLTVAILLILWVTAIAGALVDNVPLTTMMVKIVVCLAKNKKLQLPLQPLVWALAFGACLGGNGTLIGSTANVVCAGVAEQHGYRFSFMKFFKIGFPVLLSSTTSISVYLIIAHVIFGWNG